MLKKIECNCKECGKIFYEYISRIHDGRGKYCSKKCLYKSKETYLILYCKQCKKEFRAFKSQVDINREFCSKKCSSLFKHENSNTFLYGRFFKIYSGILSRCNTSNKRRDVITYRNKNIKCLWNSFEEFKNDMYDSYLQHVSKYGEKQTSIDRIDNNGNYCKKNCRWATPKIQTSNRNISINILFNNTLMNYYDFAKLIGRSTTNVYLHLKSGKTPDEIYELSKKYDNKSKIIKYD